MWFEAMHPSWQQALATQREFLESLEASIASAADTTPQSSMVMRAFEQPINQVRVVIVGQDPYPERSVAQGLAFAVDPGATKLPASLRNLMKELSSDIPGTRATGDLQTWVKQGVFLLNRHLTTAVGAPGAHSKLGWTEFTDAVIEALAAKRAGHLVAILWGAQAGQVRHFLGDIPVVAGVHPSPLSANRGFFGSKPFSLCNQLLMQIGESPIDWNC